MVYLHVPIFFLRKLVDQSICDGTSLVKWKYLSFAPFDAQGSMKSIEEKERT